MCKVTFVHLAAVSWNAQTEAVYVSLVLALCIHGMVWYPCKHKTKLRTSYGDRPSHGYKTMSPSGLFTSNTASSVLHYACVLGLLGAQQLAVLIAD